MSTIDIFFGSEAGATARVMEKVEQELSDAGFTVTAYDVHTEPVEEIKAAERLILACPTWNDGELQSDWESFFDSFQSIDLTGKKIGLIGLADQDGYGDHFANAIGTLAEPILANGGEIIGRWKTKGYSFSESTALDENGNFYGLVLDEDCQDYLTDERIKKWVRQIKDEFTS